MSTSNHDISINTNIVTVWVTTLNQETLFRHLPHKRSPHKISSHVSYHHYISALCNFWCSSSHPSTIINALPLIIFEFVSKAEMKENTTPNLFVTLQTQKLNSARPFKTNQWPWKLVWKTNHVRLKEQNRKLNFKFESHINSLSIPICVHHCGSIFVPSTIANFIDSNHWRAQMQYEWVVSHMLIPKFWDFDSDYWTLMVCIPCPHTAGLVGFQSNVVPYGVEDRALFFFIIFYFKLVFYIHETFHLSNILTKAWKKFFCTILLLRVL